METEGREIPKRARLTAAAVKAILSKPMHIPAPRTGTLQEFYGDLKGFLAHIRASTGRNAILVGSRFSTDQK